MATKKPAARTQKELDDAKDASLAAGVTKTTDKVLAQMDVTGATSGVMAQGKVGKAAREAAAAIATGGEMPGWRDPDAKYSENDNSIDARMWRLNQDHQRMGSR